MGDFLFEGPLELLIGELLPMPLPRLTRQVHRPIPEEPFSVLKAHKSKETSRLEACESCWLRSRKPSKLSLPRLEK